MKKICFLLSLCLSFAAASFAQKGTVRGNVIDKETGETLIGVGIIVKGSYTGTTTDLDGAFSLQLEPGTYTFEVSFISYQKQEITNVEVIAGQTKVLPDIALAIMSTELAEAVVVAEAERSSESSLIAMKKRSAKILDGISASSMKATGDGNAVEAARRVTGVSVEDGKYVYVRGLGDRYSKTMLNSVDIPGLDPDRNSLQMDIFPTTLIDNITVSKSFTADLPADFTGGLLNVETKDFPEEKTLGISFSTAYNPQTHLNPDFLSYEGGATDFLGFDDGTRDLPAGADRDIIPTPTNPGFTQEQVNQFVRRFNPTLAAEQTTSLLDYSLGLNFGNQKQLPGYEEKKRTLGYLFSLSYKNEYQFFDDVTIAEYQRFIDPEAYEMRYATIQEGAYGERQHLLGTLGGLAYKTVRSKIRLNLMHLQSGVSKAGKFSIDNDGEAVGQSGYFASSDNLEYFQRSLSNVLLNGTHVSTDQRWETDWRASATLSSASDPDIRKTAFTETPVDTSFIAGAGGNPARIWRSLSEINATARIDVSRKYTLFARNAKLQFGSMNTYRIRDYEILFFDIQFFSNQNWPNPDPSVVLDPENLYPNTPNSIYYQSGNNNPNPNEYSSNNNNLAFYIANEFMPMEKLRATIGLRSEYFLQNHTGRDQRFASGDSVNGRNLDNERVLDSFDFFPSLNLTYSVTENQNIRFSASQTIARPSFKELSFAQILDPISNRIFNGSLFNFSNWDGNLVETRIINIDLRWELFMNSNQMISFSAFYKNFDKPIEIVRIPEQQTSTEFQPRNVGDGQLAGLEFEFRKRLNFISPRLHAFALNGNITLVDSRIDMTLTEFNSRKTYEKVGETIENTRPMAGQSPVVINAGLTYNHPENGVNAGVFYNVKGETLYIVGAGLFPDIYTEPFHSLNVSLSKSFGKNDRTTVDFRVANLLNDRIETFYQSFRADNQIFNSINPNRTFSLGCSVKL